MASERQQELARDLRERELCCAAAVVGREFWRDAARAALEHPGTLSERELDEALAELERRSIVFALPPSAVGDDRYAFRSSLVRGFCKELVYFTA